MQDVEYCLSLCYGAWELLHFPFTLMNTQWKSLLFLKFVGYLYFESIHFSLLFFKLVIHSNNPTIRTDTIQMLIVYYLAFHFFILAYSSLQAFLKWK